MAENHKEAGRGTNHKLSSTHDPEPATHTALASCDLRSHHRVALYMLTIACYTAASYVLSTGVAPVLASRGVSNVVMASQDELKKQARLSRPLPAGVPPFAGKGLTVCAASINGGRLGTRRWTTT